MSKNKKSNSVDFPFNPENWGRWNNSKRLKWLRNFRDKLKENDGDLAKKFNLGDEQLEQLDLDVKEMEKLVVKETAKNN